jgi:DNA-binding GntR family transcriptional regulator
VPEGNAIAREVLADQVKDRLLQDILTGRYPPDARIVETSLARELGVSQAPVREALRGLEALGLVEILPFRGARVRRPTIGELTEAYAVRFALEALGARLGVPRMTDADLAELEVLCEAMQRAAAAGDRHEVAVADAAFHARLLGLAGNATLVRVWRSLEPFCRTYITLLAPGADARWTADLHLPVLAAVRERDPERVVAALRDHFDEARTRLVDEWAASSPDPGHAVPPSGSTTRLTALAGSSAGRDQAAPRRRARTCSATRAAERP